MKWIGWPKNEQGVMSGDAKAYIAEIRWGSRVDAAKFSGEGNWEGEPFDWGIGEGTSRVGGSSVLVLLIYLWGAGGGI